MALATAIIKRKKLSTSNFTIRKKRPFETSHTKMGSAGEPEIPYVDVLLVGAGFGSFTLLNKLRNLGLDVKIYEKGFASGGVWYWNCYPGGAKPELYSAQGSY